MPILQAQPGCLLYALHKTAGATGEFVMIERWASQEALATHIQGGSVQEIIGVLGDLLAGPPEVRVGQRQRPPSWTPGRAVTWIPAAMGRISGSPSA